MLEINGMVISEAALWVFGIFFIAGLMLAMFGAIESAFNTIIFFGGGANIIGANRLLFGYGALIVGGFILATFGDTFLTMCFNVLQLGFELGVI